MTDGIGIPQVLTIAVMALVPLLLIAATSFAKIVVVLTIVRNAIGADGIPPAPVVTSLAAVLSVFIMAPVASQMNDALSAHTPQSGSMSVSGIGETIDVVSPPLRDFLARNTPESEQRFFSELAGVSDDEPPGLRILLAAFASAEFIEALLMGLLILLPFLLIDLFTATVLSALGLLNLNPGTVAIPFKLLLFIAADGWHLLITALVKSYGV